MYMGQVHLWVGSGRVGLVKFSKQLSIISLLPITTVGKVVAVELVRWRMRDWMTTNG